MGGGLTGRCAQGDEMGGGLTGRSAQGDEMGGGLTGRSAQGDGVGSGVMRRADAVHSHFMPTWLATVLLIGVTAVWGLTFVMVRDAIVIYGVIPFLAVRFAIAGGSSLVLWGRRLNRAALVTGGGIGLVLAAGYLLQTWGLAHTTATNSGLITGPVRGAGSDRRPAALRHPAAPGGMGRGRHQPRGHDPAHRAAAHAVRPRRPAHARLRGGLRHPHRAAVAPLAAPRRARPDRRPDADGRGALPACLACRGAARRRPRGRSGWPWW